MQIIESLFDITYLFLVIFLGARLLFEGKKETSAFGSMAILLGIGDGFHLLPRVISHLDPAGFSSHTAALSYGRMVTSLTMTVFYVLFYHYYRAKTGENSKVKAYTIYLLSLIRIVLVLLPANNWGSANESYTMTILRNIPFFLMGILLVFWTYKEKAKTGLENMALLIALSFLFYLPVVLFSKTVPVIGSLMMPKTVCYLLIVVGIYKHYIPSFHAGNILGLSLAFSVAGLMNGVIYREFTKFYCFTAPNHLGKLHVHTLVLGFLVLFLLYLLVKHYDKESIQSIQKPFYTYLSGVIFTISNMGVQGFFDLVGGDKTHLKIAALDGMSGLGHILLSVGLVWLLFQIFMIEKRKECKRT